MTAHQMPAMLLQRDEIVAPPAQRACNDRTFELPSALYVATGLFFLGFVTVLGLAFSGKMLVSYGVIVTFMAAFFMVPALWVRMKPEENCSRSLGWSEFLEHGVATQTGHASAFEAAVLVLLLPALIFAFAVAVVTIAAVV